MIKILTVVGARPQIIKAAALSRAFRTAFSKKIKEVMVHTGQHYDTNMSQVFFDELGVPQEDYNLGAGSGSHAAQTAVIMVGIEELLIKEKPDCLLLYGDTNSTLAGAVAAAKLHLPIIHVEGGVRSFNKEFPEEINRFICDHLSTFIFVPTLTGVRNLEREGIDLNNQAPYSINHPKVFHCGDIMYDNALHFSTEAEMKSKVLEENGLKGKRYGLVTMHRPSNVDDIRTLTGLFNVFGELASQKMMLIIPIHPRTLKKLENELDPVIRNNLRSNPNLKIVPAVSFLDMLWLEKNAEIIFTDSGGVQKEAYYFKKPCVIMLEETPWPELVETGSALLTGSDPAKIRSASESLLLKKDTLMYPELFGDGKAAYFIAEKIISNISSH